MNTTNKPSAFDSLYTVVYGVTTDLTLGAAYRTRVLGLLSDLVLGWPECWNERIERDIAMLGMTCVHEPKTLEHVLGLLNARQSPLIVRVIVTLSKRAYQRKLVDSLIVLMNGATEFYLAHPEIEDAWIMAALRVAAVRATQWEATRIASAALEARPRCRVLLQALLELHPHLTYTVDSEVELFLLAPTSVAALEWASRAVEGWDIELDFQKAKVDTQLLAGVFVMAMRHAESDAVRAQIAEWNAKLLAQA
jgi:hypothetical protein